MLALILGNTHQVRRTIAKCRLRPPKVTNQAAFKAPIVGDARCGVTVDTRRTSVDGKSICVLGDSGKLIDESE